MMRSIVRGLGLGLGLVLPIMASAVFSDVPPIHPNADAIAYAQEKGIVRGYADGTFKPGKSITRAEFTKIIVAAALDYDPAKDPAGADAMSLRGLVFTDLKAGEWHIPYVHKAVQAFIVSGYPDGTFRPQQTINFAEAAKIVVRAFGIDAHTEDDELWYRPYVRALSLRSAIPTTIEHFDSPLTRGEMAEIVYRLKENIQSLTSRTYDDMAGVPDADPAPGVYADYDVDAVTGRRAVLFFHANWCPVCRAQDQELARWYETQEFPLSTYKVDYDAEAILKARYGVAYQHTFVLIDASGRAVRSITGPTDAELIELLMSE